MPLAIYPFPYNLAKCLSHNIPLAKCASWIDSTVIGKKIVLTSGDTIVVIPTIKKKDDKQKIRALIKIIEHRAYIKLK